MAGTRYYKNKQHFYEEQKGNETEKLNLANSASGMENLKVGTSAETLL